MSQKNVYLFQPQYANFILGNEQHWLPYSVGCLWAYSQQFQEVTHDWNLDGIFFRRDPIDKVCAQLVEPKLCAFSVYIWNSAYCLALAESIKQKWPTCHIVVGGPQVNSSWSQHNFIDSVVLNEGERCFVKILDDINNNRKLEKLYKMPRMDDLVHVPSPYSTGVFDDLVRNNPEIFWSATLESNRGCPYSCTFCDWGGLIASKIKKFSLERVQSDLDWIASHRVKTIFISDSNFGIYKDRDLAIAAMVRDCADNLNSDLEYISVTYAKNSTEHVFEIAKTFGPKHKGVTFSVQSMNPKTLETIKRKNMDVNDIQKLLDLSKKYNVHHYTELILGLPEETIESWKDGVCEILELGQHHRIEIWPNNVLENTEMHRDQMGRYDIKLVNVQNFVSCTGDDHSDIPELFPTVCSTNTMTTQDIIESWMYSWMVIHFHINGYSQLLAKYCRYVMNVSYREFYDHLFKLLFKHDSAIGQEARIMQQTITNFYTTGSTGRNDITAGDIQFHSAECFYQNIEHAITISLEAAEYFGDIDPGVIEIQKRYLTNNVWLCPFTAQSKININNWQLEACNYHITDPNIDCPLDQSFHFTLQRRNKKLYNIITKA